MKVCDLDWTKAEGLNQPELSKLQPQSLCITTQPHTDLWQRSYYGFQNDNAPALLIQSVANFTFTTRVLFDYRARFDQAGVLIYIDSDHWFKASIEFENDELSRLGSVVTNYGYSDWATTDISTVHAAWYRLSRRGADFLIESSFDGVVFNQMRIFHLHPLRESHNVAFGVYACSPTDSSFTAQFDKCTLEPCSWMAHEA